MKKFKTYVNKRYISLSDIDEEYRENIKNLDGYQITECCCDKCCGEPCSCETCCGSACSSDVLVDDSFRLYFYSEREIVNKLKTAVTIKDIFNLHSQFIANRCSLMAPEDNFHPLLFTETLPLPCSTELLQGKSYYDNKDLVDLIRKTELSEAVVLVRLDNSIQVFGLKYTGTNGKEGTIKNSLIEVSKKLSTLEKIPAIKWASVLDVSIDVADDVYTFLITYTVDPSSLSNEVIHKTGIIPNVEK